MKLALTLALALAATVPAQAINLLYGNRELGLSGQIDFDTVDDTLIQAELTYGYFIADYLELGGRAGISDSDSITTWRLGAFTEYNFYYERALVPYIGASVDFAGSDIELADESSDESAFVIGIAGGVKYFITDSIAITSELGFDVATEDIFPTEDGAEDTNWDLTLGLRFYF